MVLKTAEQFAQRAFDLNLLTERQLEAIWGEFGTRTVSTDKFQRYLLRQELLTNYQIERMLRGERSGFFYGDYKVLYLVGTGSFARVYRAVHSSTGNVVAVKVLRRRYSDNPMHTEQFMREGQMGTTLRHPNIVPIYEVHHIKRSYFLVMDFVEGRNLREFLKVRKKLDPLEATTFIADVIAGLAYAAERKITHRDLKLSNVLVASTGTARLVDFGLAAVSDKLTDDALANFPNPRTIDYAGLERATGVRKDDPRSDIYFAGCIYYHMLTGEPPLYETKDRVQRLSLARFQEVIPVSELEPSLPHRVAMIVNKAMALKPKQRYGAPGEMFHDLQRATVWMKSGQADEPKPLDDSEDDQQVATVVKEKPANTLLVVEPNPKSQNLLRDQLRKLGHRVLVMSDPNLAISWFESQENVANCVLFSAAKLGDAAVDAFNRFGKLAPTKAIPAILLLDDSQGDLQERAELTDHRVVVSLPIRMKEFRQLLDDLLKMTAAQPG